MYALKGGFPVVRRQQTPFQWGPPRGQIDPYNRFPYHPMMYRQQRPSRRQMRMMGSTGQMSPFGQMGSTPTRSGGGLLARIFRKKTPPMGGFPGMFPPGKVGTASAGSGSFLKSITDPSAISGFLNNTQQILSAIQQFTPMVSQYGPLVKNLPAMWKLYRGLKDATSDSENEDEPVESSIHLNDDNESSSLRNTSSNGDFKKRTNKASTLDIQDDEGDQESSDEHNQTKDRQLHERRSYPRMYI